MKLKKFQVKNYRSIRSTPTISLEKNLTIIGPNNEGKSNLVRSLVTALRVLEEHRTSRVMIANPRFRRALNSYDWEVDCPIDLQDKRDTKTVFNLQFSLTDNDIEEFASSIGSTVNEHLPITITIGRDHIPEFEVNKQGKGKAVLSRKSPQIARFIGSRLSINHIPAVRTARDAARAVERLVSLSLRSIESTPEYKQALETVENLQRPVLNELEAILNTNLAHFLPSIKNVTLDISNDRNEALRSTNIVIDDGQPTALSSKGDGVISLVSMALLANLDSSTGTDFNTVLAIEEPESHLHPRAIHNIRNIIDNIGQDFQVIVTTHSPSLVNRQNISANIIVEQSQAKMVSNISEIRDVLGVRVSDNLINSRVSIVCEGDDDSRSLSLLLSDCSGIVKSYIDNSELSFVSLAGSGNLSYQLSVIQNAICEPICFLDYDASGIGGVQSAINDGFITDEDVVYARLLGKTESELEDLVDAQLVSEAIFKAYKAKLENIPNGSKKQKFSSRLKLALEMAGRPWNEKVKADCKKIVGKIIERDGLSAIPLANRGPIDSLAALLVERLKESDV